LAGICYETGKGVDLSEDMAINYYTEAAKQVEREREREREREGGSERVKERNKERGKGVDSSEDMAINYYTEAAKQVCVFVYMFV
jgi:hypothetical protein